MEYHAESSTYPLSGVVATVTTVPAGYFPSAGNGGVRVAVPCSGVSNVTVNEGD
jgi:hypothetical protein